MSWNLTFRNSRNSSRVSWEFDLRSSNKQPLYATASSMSRVRLNALINIGN
jgi:hypothetical protein